MRRRTYSSQAGDSASHSYSSRTSQASFGHRARSSPCRAARASSESAGFDVTFSQFSMPRLSSPRTDARLDEIPAARAATSAYAAVPWSQACLRCCIHCRASVVFPYPAGATSMITRAVVSSSRRVKRGRSMMWRFATEIACSCNSVMHRGPLSRAANPTPPIPAGQGVRKDSAPATLAGRGRGCRQSPGVGCPAPRLCGRGSRPVMARYALGICRRRAQPSFCRSTSECAFAVLGEMPSRCATSSFEHPAAISSIT